MNPRSTLLAGLAVLIAAALSLGPAVATASPAPAQTPPAAPRSDEREILVMLRIPPDHFRPNATYGGDYGDQFTITSRRRLDREQRIAFVRRA